MHLSATLVAATFVAISGQAMADSHGMSTEDVLNKHLASFGAGDVDAIMEDYSNESVIILQSGVLEGTDAIRGLFEALTDEFSKPGMSFAMDATHISGDVAYIVWHAETADNVYEYATDTLIIDDGIIRTQTVAFKARPK